MPSRVRFWRARNVFEAFPVLRELRRNARAYGSGGAVAVHAHGGEILPTRRRHRLHGASAAAARGGVVGLPLRARHARRGGRRRGAQGSGGVGARTRRGHASRGAAISATPATGGARRLFLARAAGRSGGSIAAPDKPAAPAAAEACALSVQAAVVLAIAAQPAALMSGWIEACIEAGIRFAEGGDARVDPPKQPLEPAKRA